MKTAGVDTVFRYYARKLQPELPQKRLTRAEALALSEAGLHVGVVYQYHANSAEVFSKEVGLSDAAFARQYAAHEIGQPRGSAIYFGVDFDVSDVEIEKHILPHFESLMQAMQIAGTQPCYDIGVYGSWKACDRLTIEGLCKFAWLAQATGWGGKDGYHAYSASKKWTLKQGFSAGDICGLDYDPNVSNEHKPIGAFKVQV